MTNFRLSTIAISALLTVSFYGTSATAAKLESCGNEQTGIGTKKCLSRNIEKLAAKEKSAAKRKATAKRITDRCEKETNKGGSIKESPAWFMDFMVCKEAEYRKL